MTQVLERLAYVLRAETEGLAADLKGAEGHLNKFTAFVERNPLAAAGALGAAMVTVGAKAVAMAVEVEKGIKRIERVVPGATGQLGRLREEIESLSLMTPRTQAELAKAADAIARGGVESMAGLSQRLVASTRAADASGEDLQGIIGGLDQALDLFGLTSAESEAVLSKLFATAKGKFPLDDLFAALQGATPAVRQFGLSFDDALGALAALLEQGRTAKQAASELKAYGELGAEGAAAIKQLGAEHRITTEAIADYNTQVTKARDSMESAWQIAKNNFAAVMIDLGTYILPAVTTAAKAAAGAMADLNGETNIPRVAAATTTASLSTANVKDPRYGEAVRWLNRSVAEGATSAELGKLSLEQLAQMQFNLARFKAETGAAASETRLLEAALAMAQKRAAELALAMRGATAAGATGPGTPGPDGSRRGRVRTPEEIARALAAEEALGKATAKAATDAMKAVDAAMAQSAERRAQLSAEFAQWTVEQTKTLVDDIQLRFTREADRLEKAGLLDMAKTIRTAMEKAVAAQRELETETPGYTADLLRQLSDANLVGVLDGASKKTAEMVETITDAVSGAIALANAFGLVDSRSAQVVSNLSAIGANIGQAMKGDLGSIFQVAGNFAQLMRGLFGRSEQELRLARENRANTRAVERLADRLGDLLDSGFSGRDVVDIGSATGQLLNSRRGRMQKLASVGWDTNAAFKDADEFYESLGIPFADVKRLAESLGVTLNGTAESFRELDRAIKLADFAAYVSSFAGQLALLNDSFEVFDIGDSAERYRRTLALLMDPEVGAPALFGLLGAFDTSTAAGAAGAKSALQDLFRRAAAGEVTGDELGGLSPQQFLDTVKRMLQYLGAGTDAIGAGGANVGVISGFRGLTEAAGNRLADYARAQLDVQQRMLAALERWAVPSLVPPSLGLEGAGAGAVVVHFTQHNYGATDASAAAAGAGARAGVRLGVEEALTTARLKRAYLERGDLRAFPA